MDEQQALIIGKDISPALAATALLRQNGFTLDETAKALDISRRSVLVRQTKLPPGLCLTSKKLVKASVSAVKTIVAGGLVGQMEKVNGGHVLTAAQMVLDRHQPIKSSGEAGSTTNYTQVNINLYGT